MRHIFPIGIGFCLASFALAGCQTDAPTHSNLAALERFANSDWSEPVNLGTTINSTASDQNATLTKDRLTLYFSSNRLVPQPNGDLVDRNLDIWVSQRLTTADPWGAPVNLEAINTASADLAPNLSVDGHLLFFTSNRPGSNGIDIWMSSREDTDDDFAWGPPVRLGPAVNTASADQAPMYLQSAEVGSGNLYFNRGVLGLGQGDIYYASITRDGETLGDSVAVTELNSSANDAAVSIRADGREIFFWSSRLGTQDLFTSTRRSVHDRWSEPIRLAAPLSTASNDLTPSVSFDGRTLIFSSNRTPTVGGNDLWIATRTPSGE